MTNLQATRIVRYISLEELIVLRREGVVTADQFGFGCHEDNGWRGEGKVIFVWLDGTFYDHQRSTQNGRVKITFNPSIEIEGEGTCRYHKKDRISGEHTIQEYREGYLKSYSLEDIQTFEIEWFDYLIILNSYLLPSCCEGMCELGWFPEWTWDWSFHYNHDLIFPEENYLKGFSWLKEIVLDTAITIQYLDDHFVSSETKVDIIALEAKDEEDLKAQLEQAKVKGIHNVVVWTNGFKMFISNCYGWERVDTLQVRDQDINKPAPYKAADCMDHLRDLL